MKEARKKKDLAITGWMAKWYDKNTRASRLAEMREYADLVSDYRDGGAPTASVLEIAPGPGYLAIELARRGFAVTGVEISADFVEIEKRNAREAGMSVDFKQGSASSLPLPDGGFDFIICSAAFKNFSEPLAALREMYRVLAPNSVALILDMNHDATKEDIEEQVRKSGMKGFDRWFVRLSFMTFLKNGAYTRDGFEELIAQTEFPRHEIKKRGIGFEVWLYKGQ
jgi:ubiquinone/menaquinone biosynthesis C-methylase UbiE